MTKTPHEKMDERLNDQVVDLEYEVTRCAHQVIDRADSLMRTLEGAKNRMQYLLKEAKEEHTVLGKRTGLNSLGELQGNGVEFDRLCSELNLKQDELRKAYRLLAIFQKEA